MVLVAFLRGVNVGGRRTFRPSVLAKELQAYDVENIGAAGTFIVRNPGSQAKLRAALQGTLPFACEVMLCDSRELVALALEHPFGASSLGPDVVRFVSILPKASFGPTRLPISLPRAEGWLVQLLGCRGRFIFGHYRRSMKTIGYLGQIDSICGARVTTRNWNTMTKLIEALRGPTP